MKEIEIRQEILSYLISESKISEASSQNISDQTDLIENGIIDSIGILELLVFIEGKFDVELNQLSITAENMRSISSIVKFISLIKE